MMLSIVMMVKNEQKYLENTLKSLKPLMDKINNELIILDTGSTDNTVDIAKRYTSNVYLAKWNDNFGYMRNKSISYANGDWILILDADEKLVEYEKLIEFFNTDLYKSYNCASIELKSVVSEDEKVYNRTSILRLFKKDGDFRYEGAIHEQPIFKEPIYNDIAYFNHYGYMYENEEIKQKKLERNEKILLSELKLNPQNPYIHYQLAKNFSAYGDKEEALAYMKSACNIYSKLGMKYIAAESGLAKLYFEMGKYEKCEKLCKKYIKKDNKNIDIYCYLALSQKGLRKYKESLDSYNRYIYLIDNYDISSQSNNVYCTGDTISFRENSEIDIINIYYILEMYEDIERELEDINYNKLKNIYLIAFVSLYKLKKEEKILYLYEKISHSLYDKLEFQRNLEKMILSIKQSDRKKIYNVLSGIKNNYGILNQIRLGKRLSEKEYNEIIIKEKEVYYADLIYYGLKQGIDLVNILQGASNVYIQNYFNYIINYKRDCILDMYNYLSKAPNTLDLNKLSIYSSLSKSLLLSSNLKDEKYENLFLMYIKYSHYYLKQIYNQNLTEKELLNLVKSEEDKFIIDIIIIQKLKEIDKIKYIRQIKELLIDNPQYKEGIQILINKFEKELNESEELRELKTQYKSIIENSINCGNLKDAINMIDEYESMYDEEYEILNMKSIIALLNNNFDDAEIILKKSLLLENNNFNTMFNVGYLKEVAGEIEEAVRFYKKIIFYSEDESMVLEAKEKINLIV